MTNLIILVFTFVFSYLFSEFMLHRFYQSHKDELIEFSKESDLREEDFTKMMPKVISFMAFVVAIPATLILSLFLAIFS